MTFMNQANNHQNDFGDVGLKNTVTTLDSLGIGKTYVFAVVHNFIFSFELGVVCQKRLKRL